MTQEKDKQETPKESPSNELPDAELDKVSGGAEPVNNLRSPKPAEPLGRPKVTPIND